MVPASLEGYRELARRRLPRFLFNYIEGGSFAGATLARNEADLRDVTLRQRVLRDVSSIDLSVSLFGEDFALPVGLGPVGLAGMCARRGEVQAVRAAQAAGAPFCLSTVSLCPLEEVAAAAGRPFWFQLYMARDRGFVRDMLTGAEAAGCSVLLLTVDLAVPGVRNRSGGASLGTPGLGGDAARVTEAMLRPGWAIDVGLLGGPHGLGNIASALGPKASLGDFMGWIRRNFDPAVTWRDVDFIRAHWKGPIVLKGILDPEDAREAAKAGVEGIVVSNHGGRQLDGALSTARALPDIAAAVSDEITVLADGGVRSGLDVVRMLALGAHGVLLGRAWAYALAAGGGQDVAHALSIIENEIRTAMALMGVTDVEQVRKEGLVVRS